MSQLELALDQIRSVRRYAEDLIDNIDPGDWFRQPSEGVTHVAWQVGHLAMAQYRLALERVRGKQAADEELMPESFLALFGKGSEPDADPAKYPSIKEIHGVFDQVHARTLDELAGLSDDVLDEPTHAPHPRFNTKLGALQWCAQHEMLHAGQIGLLRRLFGNVPLR